jgi:hypothetical protein
MPALNVLAVNRPMRRHEAGNRPETICADYANAAAMMPMGPMGAPVHASTVRSQVIVHALGILATEWQVFSVKEIVAVAQSEREPFMF